MDVKRSLKYFWYRLLWKIAPYRSNPNPIHLDLELTNRCPLKCKICYHSLKPLPFKLGDMPLQTALDILTEAKQLGFMSVKLNWRGEPLIYKGFDKVIKHAHDLGFIDIMINTCLAGARKENLKAAATYATNLKISHDEYHKISSEKLFEATDILDNYRSSDMPKIIVQSRGEEKLWCSEYEHQSSPIMKRGKKGIGIDVTNKKRKFCGQPSRRVVVSWDSVARFCCVDYKEEGLLVDWDAHRIFFNNSRMRFTAIEWAKKISNHVCKNCTSKDSYKL